MNKQLDKVQNILLHPKREWEITQYEYTPSREVILQYVLPLAALSAAATFLGIWLWGFNTAIVRISGFSTGIILGINGLLIDLLTVVLGAYLIDALAPSFHAEKNREKSMQLIAYAYTPVLVGGLLSFIPLLSMVGNLLGLYSIPLLYWGLVPMKRVPEDKKISYLIVAVLLLLLLNAFVSYLLNGLFGSPYRMPA